MFQRMKLWWQELYEDDIREAEEDELQHNNEILKKYAGKCPVCGTELAIGVAEYTVGRTCHKCGYHDFSFLYPELF